MPVIFQPQIAKNNRALSVRVIVIWSDHKLLWWDSYKGIGCASTSPESILHKKQLMMVKWQLHKESSFLPQRHLGHSRPQPMHKWKVLGATFYPHQFSQKVWLSFLCIKAYLFHQKTVQYWFFSWLGGSLLDFCSSQPDHSNTYVIII